MAISNNTNHITEFPPMPSPSSPSRSIPLQLCGLLTGDTVQVQGDTGELQFSVQFNVHRKEHHSGEPFNLPESNPPEIGAFRDCVQSSSPSSSYLTPTSSTPENHQDRDANANESLSRGDIVTRLRSGVLSPVKYYHDGGYGVSRASVSSQRRKKANKGKMKLDNVFEKMLKRRSFPIRPCNSYAFFLMVNWGVVKRFSFGETNKRLSKKWFELSRDKKKEYEDMASKDNARYKRQCILLRNDVDQETGSLADSD